MREASTVGGVGWKEETGSPWAGSESPRRTPWAYSSESSLEAGHDAGVGRSVVVVFSCLEGLDEDGVGVAVVGHHQVLIAAAGADGEAASVVRVERADGFYP